MASLTSIFRTPKTPDPVQPRGTPDEDTAALGRARAQQLRQARRSGIADSTRTAPQGTGGMASLYRKRALGE